MPHNNSLEKNPRWIDGRKVYRKLAFEIYKIEKKCNKCGSLEKLHIHHKDNNRKNNTKENLEVLCSFCHNSYHKKGKKTGKPAWNRGKKISEKTRKILSKLSKGKNNGFYGKSWEDFGGHPKGMLGKKHSDIVKKRISDASKLAWQKRRPQ